MVAVVVVVVVVVVAVVDNQLNVVVVLDLVTVCGTVEMHSGVTHADA